MKRAERIKTFLPVALVLVLTLPKGRAFLLVLLLPVFLLYAIGSGVRLIRRPAERKGRALRLAVWSVALVLAGTVQICWSAASRSDAEMTARKVLAHKEHAGRYPASLGEVGLDEGELREKWGIRYSVREGKPALAYPAPLMPLTLCEYDFESRAWRRNAY